MSRTKNEQKLPPPKEFSKLYRRMVNEVRKNENILGLILAGSRAKNLHTAKSDCDLYIIFRNDYNKNFEKFRKEFKQKYKGLMADLSKKALQKLVEFKKYGLIGTAYGWNRYDLVHAKVEFDKENGEITKILKEKQILTRSEEKLVIKNNLGPYITNVYMSVKNLVEGNNVGSRLDATESLHYLLTTLFAIHGRVTPFNKYLEWEVTHYPLEKIKWKPKKLIEMITKIIEEADTATQIMVYQELEKLCRERGYGRFYNVWGAKLDFIKEQIQRSKSEEPERVIFA